MDKSAKRALEAMRSAGERAERLGIADMSLDEINAEIAEARKEMKARENSKGSPDKGSCQRS
ncbi:MAG: hypothetical protein LUE20_10780 [Oscillospiraceae bacterium]|nr:hypothetical protein [Oscillospiraceae bacterium]